MEEKKREEFWRFNQNYSKKNIKTSQRWLLSTCGALLLLY
jgi:hypothetical protein